MGCKMPKVTWRMVVDTYPYLYDYLYRVMLYRRAHMFSCCNYDNLYGRKLALSDYRKHMKYNLLPHVSYIMPALVFVQLFFCTYHHCKRIGLYIDNFSLLWVYQLVDLILL